MFLKFNFTTENNCPENHRLNLLSSPKSHRTLPYKVQITEHNDKNMFSIFIPAKLLYGNLLLAGWRSQGRGQVLKDKLYFFTAYTLLYSPSVDTKIMKIGR